MKNIASFHSDSKFFDDANFPYGIDRCGEFSRACAELLIKHGWAYKALGEGLRAPANKEEKLFVEVCQGKRQPATDHEKAWLLYCRKVSLPKVNVKSSLLKAEAISEEGSFGINLDQGF
jgi:uncharacterized protein YifE (UPF0438 family)